MVNRAPWRPSRIWCSIERERPVDAPQAREDEPMTQPIYIPTREELAARIGRFAELQPMSTATDLAWVPQAAMDIVYARKIMPVILDDTKNPFGKIAPIFGAAGTTMFISILPPGQGPCLHSHNDTFETFFVLEGRIEYEIGEPVTHRVTLDKWDCLSCPPRIYRGFRNVGEGDAVQLTVITGLGSGRDDVSMPHSIAERVRREHGPEVLDAFKSVFQFDPPPAAANV
jgi:mannose-6-phosphate isomerase-like protein (cupin superfamily)